MTTKRITITSPVLIAGMHVGAGETVEVESGLAGRLMASNKACPAAAPETRPQESKIHEGKQTKAIGLTTGNSGDLITRAGR